MAMGRMAANDVPVARLWLRFAQITCSGTMTKPPPTPSSPPAKPPIAPIAASMRGSDRSCASISGSREPTDVQLHHFLIIEQLPARPLEAVLPEHQHVGPLCVPEGLAGVLLDDEDRDIGGADLLDPLPDQALELRRETGARF